VPASAARRRCWGRTWAAASGSAMTPKNFLKYFERTLAQIFKRKWTWASRPFCRLAANFSVTKKQKK
jgi:hypothetical protein